MNALAEVHEDGVENLHFGVAAQAQSALELGVNRSTYVSTQRADGRYVGEESSGFGCGVVAGTVVVALKTFGSRTGRLVRDLRVANNQGVLNASAETEVAVQVVVQVAVRNQVLGIHRAAEPLKSVVVDERRLNVVDHGVAAHRTHGQTVDFLVHLVRVSTEFDAEIANDAAVIVVVWSSSAAKFRIWTRRQSFDVAKSVGQVVGSFTQKNDSAPVADGTGPGSCAGREDDRLRHRSVGHQFGALGDDQGRTGRGHVAADNGTGLDGQNGVVLYINGTAKQVNVVAGPRGVRHDVGSHGYGRSAVSRRLRIPVGPLVCPHGGGGRSESSAVLGGLKAPRRLCRGGQTGQGCSQEDRFFHA